MSWSVSFTGTREETKTKAGVSFDNEANRYPEGNAERDDILACKARAMTLLDKLEVNETAGERARVYAYGSHSATERGISSASAHLEVSRVS